MLRSVGVIGLGAMGQGVAKNLIQAGFEVYGCDLREASRAAFVALGGKACDTPAELGKYCDIAITLVINAEQTEDVIFGPAGLAQSFRVGGVLVAAATVAPAYVVKLGDRLSKQGVDLIDSPVSGGVVGAANGELVLLSSGPETAFEKCRHVLDAIASRVFRLGPEPGLGSRMKVINQLLVGVHIAAAAEAMALGLREGVDLDQLYEVITHSAGNSWAFADRGPRILEGKYVPAQTALDIFVKDLGLVLETGRSSKFPLPLASAAYQIFASVSAAGLGMEDDTAVIKAYPGIALPGSGESRG